MELPTHAPVVTVRDFTWDDIPAMAQLMGELGYPTSPREMAERMRLIAEHPAFRTVVAEVSGEVAGVIGLSTKIMYEQNDVLVQVHVLVVQSRHRGRGVGKALMARAEAWAREVGASGLYLTSGFRPERTRAHEFYKDLGFDVTGYRFVKRF